ncbi:carboxynorspermidine decarboxylase [Clostridia bacterium]|nr:carboxynorspermidine decarboxylase [Clostridia bacterium]
MLTFTDLPPSVIKSVRTPCYIVEEARIHRNMDILADVAEKSGAKILLAQKAFSMHSMYPTMRESLAGTSASGLYEARLGHDKFGSETHVFSPAYKDEDFGELTEICDHIVFNSFAQLRRFKVRIKESGRKISVGLRINPQYSEVENEKYNPCAVNSRLGITLATINKNDSLESDFDGVEGLHLHTMCEMDSDVFTATLDIFREEFGYLIDRFGIKWVNFGGGQHITKPGYDTDKLVTAISDFIEEFGVDVYLEPGEATALYAGVIVASVIDIVRNDEDTLPSVILDTSAACHMPDILEAPYHPEILGAGDIGDKRHDYLLTGPTCLAGDIIGGYSFDFPLETGDRIVIGDTAHYSMVKNNTFNGTPLPDICIYSESRGIEVVKSFGYDDFVNRLS